ncbi:unnamed protein product, partial [Phaeothamnion confervicola]
HPLALPKYHAPLLYAGVIAFGIYGTMARTLTDRLFGDVLSVEGSDRVVPVHFFANVFGGGILGFMAGSPLDEESAPLLYTAFATGFCGCMTTFCSWAVEESRLLLQDHSPLGQPQTAAITSIAVTLGAFLLTFVAGYDLGAAFGAALDRRKDCNDLGAKPQPLRRIPVHVAAYAVLALLAATLVVLALLLALDGPSQAAATGGGHADYWLAAFFSPPGAAARFFLARCLNPLYGGRFPLGTFAANFGGTVILAAFDASGAAAGEDIGTWAALSADAFRSGFLSSLTTMSTFTAEV